MKMNHKAFMYGTSAVFVITATIFAAEMGDAGMITQTQADGLMGVLALWLYLTVASALSDIVASVDVDTVDDWKLHMWAVAVVASWGFLTHDVLPQAPIQSTFLGLLMGAFIAIPAIEATRAWDGFVARVSDINPKVISR